VRATKRNATQKAKRDEERGRGGRQTYIGGPEIRNLPVTISEILQ